MAQINTTYNNCKFIIGAGLSSPGETMHDVNQGNRWLHCTFNNAEAMFARSGGNTDVYLDDTNEFVNCIVNDVATLRRSGSPNPSWDHNDFWSGFAAEGTNASTVDPDFVDLVNFTPQEPLLRAGIALPEVVRDKDGKLRDPLAPTMGAVEMD